MNDKRISVTMLSSEDELATWLKTKGSIQTTSKADAYQNARTMFNRVLNMDIAGSDNKYNVVLDSYMTGASSSEFRQYILNSYVIMPKVAMSHTLFVKDMKKATLALSGYVFLDMAFLGEEIFVPIRDSSSRLAGCMSFRAIYIEDRNTMYCTSSSNKLTETNYGGIGKVFEILLRDMIDFTCTPLGTIVHLEGDGLNGRIDIKSVDISSNTSILRRDGFKDYLLTSIDSGLSSLLGYYPHNYLYSSPELFLREMLTAKLFNKDRVVAELGALPEHRYPLAAYLHRKIPLLSSTSVVMETRQVEKFMEYMRGNIPSYWEALDGVIQKEMFEVKAIEKLPLEDLMSLCPEVDSTNYRRVISEIIEWNYKGISGGNLLLGSDEESLKEVVFTYLKMNAIPAKVVAVEAVAVEAEAVTVEAPSTPEVSTEDVKELKKVRTPKKVVSLEPPVIVSTPEIVITTPYVLTPVQRPRRVQTLAHPTVSPVPPRVTEYL